MFLEVALPLPLQQTFYYRWLNAGLDLIEPGQRVLVPFQNRRVTAYVIRKLGQLPADSLAETHLKDVLELLDERTLIPPDLFKLSQWISDYYFAPLGEVLRACLPPKMNMRTKKRVKITLHGLDALTKEVQTEPLIPDERRTLQLLEKWHRLEMRQLNRLLGKKANESTLRSLVSKSWIQIEQVFGQPALAAKRQMVVSLNEEKPVVAATTRLTPAQVSVIRYLETLSAPVLVSELLQELMVSYQTLRSLETKGVVRLWKERIQRDPFKDLDLFPNETDRVLTQEQKLALRVVEQELEIPGFKPILLHGVTGSGKTEIYLSLIEQMLQSQKDSLMLIPEIGLTPRVAQEFRARLGREVAILHSGLGQGERFDEWWRIKQGEAKVVVGTRSAVFAPLQNLKLIVVDEEHDPSYKQQESPRYHARDVALVRGKMLDALLLLGSATPAVETFYNARSGKYKYIRLASRVRSRPLPQVKLVDMREDFRESEKRSVLSAPLANAIEDRLNRKEQTLILLNRRGFSTSLLCRSCGQSIQCRNCSISLTYHRAWDILLCHYCGYRHKVPKQCPQCNSEHLYFLGEGTEKVEALLEKNFPKARVSRLDRDAVRKKNAHARILRQFQMGEADILVGTQMISKGHDFPNVTLVGVISAEHTLSFPDFRSAERTFQLLSQMSGRAGRGELAGKVLIQTYFPEHYCLRFVTQHDYEGFYEKEIRFRKFMHYPPFNALANILVHDKSLEKAAKNVNQLGSLVSHFSDNQIRILGPTVSTIARIKSEHRFQLILKSASRARLNEVIWQSLRRGEKEGLELRKVHIDIDPVTLM